MKVQTMLLSSFLGMALITFIVGFVAFSISSSTLKDNREVYELAGVTSELITAMSAHNAWKASLEEDFVNNNKEISVQLDGHKCGFGTWYYSGGLDKLQSYSPDAAAALRSIEEAHLALHSSAKEISSSWTTIHEGLGQELYQRLNDHLSWAAQLLSDIIRNRESQVQADPTLCGFGQFLASEENERLEEIWPEYKAIMVEVKKHHVSLHHAIPPINRARTVTEKYNLYEELVDPELKIIGDRFQKIIDMESLLEEGQSASKDIFRHESLPQLELVISGIKESIAIIDEEQSLLKVKADRKSIVQNTVIWIGIGLGVLFGLLIAIFITRRLICQLGGEPDEISRIAEKIANGDLAIEFDNRKEIGIYSSMKHMALSLNNTMTDITKAADQVSSGSNQISASSQQISTGASEQASSTEEISSSMEELTANIQQNTENAQKADAISRQTSENAALGGKSVNETVQAMKSISEKIGIIEEIARNTNMLALNAAIEAARAGEAGKGFAVVASEVRKLAENSGRAASEITEISISSVKAAETAGTIINELVPQIQNSADLVQEITSASEEQFRGAEQINSALLQLDTVIQQNASSSEELASMSEELNSQSEMMLSTISYFKLKDEGKKQMQTIASPPPNQEMKPPFPEKNAERTASRKADKREIEEDEPFLIDEHDGEFESF